MDSCEYEVIGTHSEEDRLKKNEIKSTWTPFLRQLFVSSGVWSIYFVLGLGFGAPTVMIPQIRKEANSTNAVSEDMESWLSSVHGYSSLPWVFIISIMTKYIGRRIPFFLVCINTLGGFIIFYYTTDTTYFLISAVMLGILLASNMTLLVIIITEYSSPRYRGLFMIFESTFFFWGVWIANFIGAFYHWKNIGIIAIVFSVYPLSVVFWPESPYWLAMKGSFNECIASHHWLKGFDKDSEYELETLISSQKEYIKMCSERKKYHKKDHIKSIFATMSTKAFYMPMLISISVMCLYHFSGKLVCSMYAINVMNKITGNEHTSRIGMLVMDSVTIIGMQAGCGLSKFLKRRTLLLSSATSGTLFLYIISAYLFLVNYSIFTESTYISITLLTLFSVSISMGPMIMPCTIFGELICLRYQTPCLLLITLFSECLMATILKISPLIFDALTLPGAFLYYGISASIFCVIVYRYLPETKDKTLFEIENYFKPPVNSRDAVKVFINKN